MLNGGNRTKMRINSGKRKNQIPIFEKITDEAKNSDFELSEPAFMVLEKRIRKRKGKWWQLPSDLHSENN